MQQLLRIGWACALAILAALAAPSVARAANANCASLQLYPFPGSPLTNAALSCDANGQLVITDQALFSAAYGQASGPNSYIGIAGWSTLGGGTGTDALVDGPSGGPYTAGSGYLGLPLGTPGILYVQGIGPSGAVPIYSSTGFPITDSTLTYTASVNSSNQLSVTLGSQTVNVACTTGCSPTVQPVQGVSGGVPVPVVWTSPQTVAIQAGSQVSLTGTASVAGTATPTAVPTGPYLPVVAYQGSNGLTVPVAADQTAPFSLVTTPPAATFVQVQVVAGVAGKSIHVTGYQFQTSSSTFLTDGWVAGTTTTTPCDTGTVTLIAANGASQSGTINQPQVGGTLGQIMVAPAGDNLCLTYKNSTAVSISITGPVWYAQF